MTLATHPGLDEIVADLNQMNTLLKAHLDEHNTPIDSPVRLIVQQQITPGRWSVVKVEYLEDLHALAWKRRPVSFSWSLEGTNLSYIIDRLRTDEEHPLTRLDFSAVHYEITRLHCSMPGVRNDHAFELDEALSVTAHDLLIPEEVMGFLVQHI